MTMTDNCSPSRKKSYTPHTNILCCYRLNCGAEVCPRYIDHLDFRPRCRIEKFDHYRPEFDTGEWYEKSWEEVRKITWYDVVTLRESWMYLLILITIAVFIFFCTTLISLYRNSVI